MVGEITSRALMRIEYKLDLIIRALQTAGAMISELPVLSEINGDFCPLCEEEILVVPDLTLETYNRTCGCRPPMPIVPGISSVVLKPQTDKDETYDREESPEPSDDASTG